MTTELKKESATMNMFEQFEFPAQNAPSKHSNVFDHYAASQVNAINGQHWDEDVFFPQEQQFQPTPSTAAMTISPAELLSTASTVNNCFSDVEHTPLIEATDLTLDASTWTPLFSFEDGTVKPTENCPADSVSGATHHLPIAPQPAPQQSPETYEEAGQPPSFAKALALEVDRKLKRKQTVVKAPPQSNGNKVDKNGITVYNRKPRQTPLRPVDIPDHADSATAKRARNTEAARRSRARKMERMSQLEERVQELVQERDALEAEVERLKTKCGEL